MTRLMAGGFALALTALSGAALAEPACAPQMSSSEEADYVKCLTDRTCDPAQKWPAYHARKSWVLKQGNAVLCDLVQNHPDGRPYDDLLADMEARLTRSCRGVDAESGLSGVLYTQLNMKGLEVESRRFAKENGIVRPGPRADRMRCR